RRRHTRFSRDWSSDVCSSDLVDRVVLLGIGGSYMGARALFEGCCNAYHNELCRAARDGWPRMYFEGNNVDNDASRELLDLVNDEDRKSTRLNSSHVKISYAVF